MIIKRVISLMTVFALTVSILQAITTQENRFQCFHDDKLAVEFIDVNWHNGQFRARSCEGYALDGFGMVHPATTDPTAEPELKLSFTVTRNGRIHKGSFTFNRDPYKFTGTIIDRDAPENVYLKVDSLDRKNDTCMCGQ